MRKNNDVKILLVNPPIIDFKAFDLWMKPMGLLYISAVLRKNNYKVRLIDCMDRNHPSVVSHKKIRTNKSGKFYCEIIKKPEPYKKIPRNYKKYGIPTDALIYEIKNTEKPDLIMVTSIMTYWYPGVHMAISILKEHMPGVPIMLGGIYATLCGDFARRNSGADFVVEGCDIKEILKKIGEITSTKPDFIPENFLTFPYPDFSHYPVLDYGCILTSAGCPYRCTYCASGILQPWFIQKSPRKIINEIFLMAAQHNVSHFAFYDDALLVNPEKHIIPILKMLIKKDTGFSFHAFNGLHARFIDKNMAFLMKKGSFKTICLGLETKDPHLLEVTGGKVKTNEFEEAVKNLFNAGFTGKEVAVYLMMGIPGQTYAQVDETIEYIHSLGLQGRLSFFSPVPGTPDFNDIKKQMPEIEKDPLYHNDTYQRYSGRWAEMEDVKRLKDKIHRMNMKIIG